MKDPVKLARKQLPKYGGNLLRTDSRSATFLLPNGGTWSVNRGTPLRVVRDVIDDSYLITVGLRGYVHVAGPEIVPDQIKSSDHFLERLELMHSQCGVTMREVLEALARPKRVLATKSRDTLALLGERVTPILRQDDDALVLITLYWSRAELWARFPRPESEK